MNFAGVQSITIPEGDVRSIAIGGVTVWTKPNPLPYDAEVEYVESTGAQYVDTGMLVSDLGAISATVQIPDAASMSSGNVIIMSARARAGAYTSLRVQCRYANAIYADAASGRILVGVTPNIATSSVFSVRAASDSFVVSGDVSGSASVSGFDGQRTLLLLRDAVNGDLGATCRLYAFSYERAGGALVRDFVPVRVGTAGFLYDRANPTGGPSGNGLYGSATSTPLVAGPDKNGGAA